MDQKGLEEFLSIKQYVHFKDVEVEYIQGKPFKCCYSLMGYTSQEGDRIAIYKVGWNSVKQYFAFEWVPINNNKENSVCFNKYSLPKNTTDLFQLCYISNHNETYGVSTPFQFVKSKSKLYDSLKSSMCDSAYSGSDLEKEIGELKAENQLFRHKMRAVMNILTNMQSLMLHQQAEIDGLKEKVDEMTMTKKNDKKTKHFDVDLEELDPLPPFPLY
ncbi:calcium-binding and coiled-coil domain-containing protein 2-like [Onthophagus taurus]|uniref:calcium-binding and coiled-coil domain-containing protein 2-like n=1 Tax=Onthophagus taurus TaxID=166361 RepID=UPI000C201E19|nr:calcium-binding and coiled-coil domain-containing protein 2-like [Onthophagus taurus]